MRFKVLEERVKTSNGNSKFTVSDGRNIGTGPSRRQSFGEAESLSASSSNGYQSRKNSISRSGSLRSNSANVLLKHAKLSSSSFDGGSRNLERERPTSDANGLDNMPTNYNNQTITRETITTHEESANGTPVEKSKSEKEVAAMRISKEHDHRAWQASAPRGAVNSQSISSRSIFYLFVFFVVILCFLFLIVNYKNIYFFYSSMVITVKI